MSIYKSSINRPITTLLIFVGVMIIGIFSLIKLPIDQLPEMEPPYISVMTTYAGGSASEIETNITKLLENGLNSVDGLVEITSTSKDNMSLLNLELEWGEDLDEAVNDIRAIIDILYEQLPEGCSKPLIFKFNTSMMPIMMYAVTAEKSYAGLEKILDEKVISVLNKIEGIGNLSIAGSPKRYVYVDVNPNKLDAYNLTVEAIGQAISGNNIDIAAGSVKMGKEQYQLHLKNEYLESEEINNIVVANTFDGKQVFLRDVATVRDTLKDVTFDEKINGKDGARLVVMKRSNANTVEICENVEKELAKIIPTLPKDIKIQQIYAASTEINNAINGLTESIMYGFIFVALVVLFFLGRWRATLIISLTIPISLVVSFIYLLFTDSSINIISLSSLTVAIGMVVDDAIVVLENISRHIDRGAAPREASIYATNEVWVAVIATTLVLVVVFVPLTMIGGMVGMMFKEMGWVITFVIVVSTIVAISLTPMLASKLLKAKEVTVKDGRIVSVENKDSWYQRVVVSFLDKVDMWYADFLRTCLRNKKKTILIAFLIFVISLIPLATGMIGTGFMPEQDVGRLAVTMELQQGTRIEETMKLARKVEAELSGSIPEIRIIATSIGSSDEGGMTSLFSSASNSKVTMNVNIGRKYQRERSIFQIAEVVSKTIAQFPEVAKYQVNTSSGMGGAEGTSIDIEVYGYDFEKTNAVTAEIKERLSKFKGARNIKVSREDDRPELKIVFDKEKLAINGLNASTASIFVRNRITGMNAGYLHEDGEEYDIIVRLAEEYRSTITDIEEITLMSPMGAKIKLKELASIEEHWTPPNIERKNRQRYVKVSVTPVGISLGDLAKLINTEVGNIELPTGIRVNVGGSYEDQQEAFADIGLLFILIIMLVYIVMASQFESYSKPFIIMMAVPFAITGSILALYITGVELNLVAALGIVLLVGIVVKNGIVLVDYINLMRDRGYELNEAVALSGRSRLRPVLMTAFTTILGMVPMALSTSEGSEVWVPMGVVVIGGLLVSTLVTLIIVPVLYVVMVRRGDREKEEKLRKQFIFMDLSGD
jgi:HAE1 family hydrophobic/amphiphilic exporter-1